ncbi:MAG: thioredoxin domain-containing protein [Oligoflexia bacterium]|nr:thioredoxin domain-containing protein [Oligoflexia bacterium]
MSIMLKIVNIFTVFGILYAGNADAGAEPLKTQLQKAPGKTVKKIADDITRYGIAPMDYERFKKQELVNIDLEKIRGRAYGNDKAIHSLIVFTDFSCGKSKKADAILKKRVMENKGKLALYYVLFPLDEACNPNLRGRGRLSDKSCVYARTALCAEKHGKFNETVSLLFNGEAKDIEKDCVNSEWASKKLAEENALYKNIAIRGTPTVLLDKRRIGSVYKFGSKFNGLLRFMDVDFNRIIKKQ